MELNELHKKFINLSALLFLVRDLKDQIKDEKFLEDEHDKHEKLNTYQKLMIFLDKVEEACPEIEDLKSPEYQEFLKAALQEINNQILQLIEE